MRIAALLILPLLVNRAAAQLPSPARSSIPTHVLIVGRAEALADTALGAFTVVARDAAGNPLPGRTIEFRMLNCDAQGLRVSASTYQTGVAPACGTHAMTSVTDATGSVRMAVVGGRTTPAPLPGSG